MPRRAVRIIIEPPQLGQLGGIDPAPPNLDLAIASFWSSVLISELFC
jgi:hypothetical protein